jgi:hypothetical protein
MRIIAHAPDDGWRFAKHLSAAITTLMALAKVRGVDMGGVFVAYGASRNEMFEQFCSLHPNQLVQVSHAANNAMNTAMANARRGSAPAFNKADASRPIGSW